MQLFVGLGNPGSKYEKTRHNIGFMAVDAIADAHGFSSESKRFQGLLREGRIGSEKILLLKPQTYMNESGRSVGEALRFYKLAPEDVVVFHDELDLAPGKIRVKKGGGHAGHNGLRSLHAHIGEAYRRVRLGIGHPGHKSKVSGYVLNDFAKAEQDALSDLLLGIGKFAPSLAQGEDSRFQSDLAQFLNGRAGKDTDTSPAREKSKSPKAVEAKPAEKQEKAGESPSPFEALKSLLKGSR